MVTSFGLTSPYVAFSSSSGGSCGTLWWYLQQTSKGSIPYIAKPQSKGTKVKSNSHESILPFAFLQHQTYLRCQFLEKAMTLWTYLTCWSLRFGILLAQIYCPAVAWTGNRGAWATKSKNQTLTKLQCEVWQKPYSAPRWSQAENIMQKLTLQD
jgi:hypothetical protein